jgi:hypothetical protein
VEQESQLINGPQEYSISGSNSIPWIGIFKYLNIVHGSSQISSKNFHESNDSDKSVDEESKVTSIVSHEARMAKKALKTPDNNNGV